MNSQRSYVVWAYHRFAFSMADVEGLLAERGVVVSREPIRLWVSIPKLRDRAGKAGCFGIGKAPCRVTEIYQIKPDVAGFSDVP